MNDRITIISRKFDGRISKSWQAELLEQSPDLLIFKGVFDFDVDHKKLGFIKRGTISYEFYWPEKWYNIFRFHEPGGNLSSFYCNVAMPPTFEDGKLDYVDLDIDVLADSDLKYQVLDLEEFEERTHQLGYSSEILARARSSMEELITLIKTRQSPFDYQD